MSKARARRTTIWYTYCPVIHAGNVDEGLGWIRDEVRRKAGCLRYFRSFAGRDYYAHFVHDLDHLIRFGGCTPAIHVRADLRETLLIGLQWLGECGGMLVRTGEGIREMRDLKDRRIGLSKSLNPRKCDWWRAMEERGIELMLTMNSMSHDDVEIIEFPYADDWYDEPEMLEPMESAADVWRSPEHTSELTFRPLVAALAAGLIDACFTVGPFAACERGLGRFKVIENLSRFPDWTLQVGNAPYALTVDVKLADRYPELVVAYMKGMLRVGRFCNANRTSATAILEGNSFYHDAKWTEKAIADIDFVPNLSLQNLNGIEIQKRFLLSRGYIRNDFDVADWAAPEFAEQAARELVEEQYARSSRDRLALTESRQPRSGSLEAAQLAAAHAAAPGNLPGGQATDPTTQPS